MAQAPRPDTRAAHPPQDAAALAGFESRLTPLRPLVLALLLVVALLLLARRREALGMARRATGRRSVARARRLRRSGRRGREPAARRRRIRRPGSTGDPRKLVPHPRRARRRRPRQHRRRLAPQGRRMPSRQGRAPRAGDPRSPSVAPSGSTPPTRSACGCSADPSGTVRPARPADAKPVRQVLLKSSVSASTLPPLRPLPKTAMPGGVSLLS